VTRGLDPNTGFIPRAGAGIYSASSRFPSPKLPRPSPFHLLTTRHRSSSSSGTIPSIAHYSLPTISCCEGEIPRALSGAISHWSCTIYPHHRVPRGDTASNSSPTQYSSSNTQVGLARWLFIKNEQLTDRGISLVVLSHQTAILVSHCPLAVSPISPVFSLSRITSIPFPEGLPGEWARPESHTLPKPTESTSQCFLPPLHRVPAHLPSQNPRGCTFCPIHLPIREIIPPETRLETPKLYYLPIPPIPSVCSTKPRPLPRGLAHPAFSSMHTLRFASTHNTTPLRDGAQEEEGTQGPEC
jgi:hypothetical protein